MMGRAARLEAVICLGNNLSWYGMLGLFRAWFVFVLIGAVVGAVISFAAAAMTPPTYAAQATLLVTPASSTVAMTFSDIELDQAVAPTFAELATTVPVLDRVIAKTDQSLTAGKLAPAVATRVPVGTSLIEITVTQKDPELAATLANAIAAELVAYPTSGLQSQGALLSVALTVVEPASVPTTSEGPGLFVRMVLGGLIGLFIAVALAVFVENLRARSGASAPPQPA
jgi:succinoglycan biosynthesis transport protein ExoP